MAKNPERLTFDEVFDLVALIFACRGTCDRLRTATVIRDVNNVLIATGYNGSLPGADHCDDVGHLVVDGHCLRTNHGEENSLLNCLNLAKIKDGVATVIGNPCYPCARKLAFKGINRMRLIGGYSNAQGGDEVVKLYEERKIKIEYVGIEDVLETLKKAIAFLQGPGGPFKDLPKIKIVFENDK